MRNIVNDEIARLLVLEDNGSPYGGTSHADETLGEFMDDTCYPSFTLKELNDALNSCGIKRVATPKELRKQTKKYFEESRFTSVATNRLFELIKYVDVKFLAYWLLKDVFGFYYNGTTKQLTESLSETEAKLMLNAYIYFNYR